MMKWIVVAAVVWFFLGGRRMVAAGWLRARKGVKTIDRWARKEMTERQDEGAPLSEDDAREVRK